jgi:shikimate kinase
MPGCGKTTVGVALARALEQIFLDADSDMERRSGKTIAAIFASHGEAVFRRYERLTLFHLIRLFPHAVLSTGGGAFAQEKTRTLLLENTITLWLDVPPEILAERLAGDTRRPLLAGDNPAERLRALADARRESYRQAFHRIDAAREPEQVVQEILALLA